MKQNFNKFHTARLKLLVKEETHIECDMQAKEILDSSQATFVVKKNCYKEILQLFNAVL